MKKSLVLAMAMALGVTASAYAANPFSDVPAGHWAYDSVNKLAAAGIVDGYGDSTFGGDRLLPLLLQRNGSNRCKSHGKRR